MNYQGQPSSPLRIFTNLNCFLSQNGAVNLHLGKMCVSRNLEVAPNHKSLPIMKGFDRYPPAWLHCSLPSTSNRLKLTCGCWTKNRGNTPKMDGEYNGKPYEQTDDLGVPLFLETPMFCWVKPSNFWEEYPQTWISKSYIGMPEN